MSGGTLSDGPVFDPGPSEVKEQARETWERFYRLGLYKGRLNPHPWHRLLLIRLLWKIGDWAYGHVTRLSRTD